MTVAKALASVGVAAAVLGLWGAGCGGGDESTVDLTAPSSTEVAGTAASPDATDDSTEPVDDERTETPVDEPDGGDVPASGFQELDPSTIPEAPAPGRLADALLPTDADGVVALFDALPAELWGSEKELMTTPERGVGATYSVADRVAPIGFQALDGPASLYSEFLPEPTADYVVALFASGADWDVEAAGRDGDRFWVEWNTTAGGEGFESEEMVSSLSFGDAGSRWTFMVTAADATTRGELLEVFVATSVTIPESPPSSTDE